MLATAIAVLVPLAFLLAPDGFEASEGSLIFWVAWVLVYPLQWTVLVAPGLASLLPSAIAWPGGDEGTARRVRRSGTAAVVLILAAWSTAGLATQDIALREEPPPHLRQPRRAITVWVVVDPGLDPTQGSTRDRDPHSKNITVPFLAANATSSNQTTVVRNELREDLFLGYDRQKASVHWASSDALAVQARDRVEFVASAHRNHDVIFEVAEALSLAGGFATADQPEDVEVRIYGHVGPKPGCHWSFDRTLPVRDAANATVGEDPVPIGWTLSDACQA